MVTKELALIGFLEEGSSVSKKVCSESPWLSAILLFIVYRSRKRDLKHLKLKAQKGGMSVIALLLPRFGLASLNMANCANWCMREGNRAAA